MGTIANKLEYLDDTKTLLAEKINDLGGNIDNSTTFREYAQELDNIYSNLPKVTGEGTSITLTPTLKGKMGIIPKGNTEQETTQGINLFKDITTQTLNGVTLTNNGDGSYTLNGTSTAWTEFRATLDSELPIGNYTIILRTESTNSNIYASVRTTTDTSIGNVSGGSSSLIAVVNITTTSDKKAGKVGITVGNANITLSNYKVRPMLVSGTYTTSNAPDFEKYTGGIASPNPSYPQNIEVVTGTQEVKVGNVNLLKDLRPSTQTLNGVTYTNNGNGTFKINGTSSAYTQFVDSDSFTLPKGTYTLSGRSASVSGATMQLRSPDGYTIITQSNTKTAFTLSEDTQVRFRIVITANITYSNAEFEPMILSGDVTQNIPTYVEHQEQTQTISLSSKNLLELANGTNTTYNVTSVTNNGTITINGTSNNTSYSKLIGTYIATKTGTYTLSPNKSTTNSDIRLLYTINSGSLINSDNTPQISLTKNDVLNVYLRISTSNQITNFILQPQLEYGSSATSYEQYYNIELCKIGNYQDYLYKSNDKWYKKEYIGKFNIDSTSWQYVAVAQGSLFRSSNVGEGIIKNVTCFCTHYTCLTQSTRTNPCTYVNRDNPVLDVIDNRYTDAGDFKTWCRTNNVLWYVPLATPQDIEITDETLVQQLENLTKLYSYNGTTNITSTSDTGCDIILSVSALKGA